MYDDLRRHFQVRGVPAFVFFDRTGKPIQHIEGAKDRETFGLILDYLRDEVYAKDISFAAYVKDHAAP